MPSFGQLLARLSDLFGMGIGAIPFANRNFFVDGAFDQWTAASGSLSGGYSPAAMWVGSAGTGGAASLGQVDMRATAASNFKFESPVRFSFNFQQTTASTGTVAGRTAPFLYQRIEGAQTASGRSVTLSFKLYVTSGSLIITGILAQQSFGSGGSPSPINVFDKAVNWVLTTTPTKFSVRLDVPSTNGKTFGTNGGDYLGIGLWLPPGVTFSMVGMEAQLEYSNPNSSSDINGNGGAPTAFEYRGIQVELARTQRYYQVPGIQMVTGYGATGAVVYMDIQYLVNMRAAPAASINGTVTYSNASALAAPSPISGSIPAFRTSITISSTGNGMAYGQQFVLDARI